MNDGQFNCQHVGAQKGSADECEVHCVNGEWAVLSPLYIMGLRAGEIVGKGPTREAAEDDLQRQLREAADSLWA